MDIAVLFVEMLNRYIIARRSALLWFAVGVSSVFLFCMAQASADRATHRHKRSRSAPTTRRRGTRRPHTGEIKTFLLPKAARNRFIEKLQRYEQDYVKRTLNKGDLKNIAEFFKDGGLSYVAKELNGRSTESFSKNSVHWLLAAEAINETLGAHWEPTSAKHLRDFWDLQDSAVANELVHLHFAENPRPIDTLITDLTKIFGEALHWEHPFIQAKIEAYPDARWYKDRGGDSVRAIVEEIAVNSIWEGQHFNNDRVVLDRMIAERPDAPWVAKQGHILKAIQKAGRSLPISEDRTEAKPRSPRRKTDVNEEDRSQILGLLDLGKQAGSGRTNRDIESMFNVPTAMDGRKLTRTEKQVINKAINDSINVSVDNLIQLRPDARRRDPFADDNLSKKEILYRQAAIGELVENAEVHDKLRSWFDWNLDVLIRQSKKTTPTSLSLIDAAVYEPSDTRALLNEKDADLDEVQRIRKKLYLTAFKDFFDGMNDVYDIVRDAESPRLKQIAWVLQAINDPKHPLNHGTGTHNLATVAKVLLEERHDGKRDAAARALLTDLHSHFRGLHNLVAELAFYLDMATHVSDKGWTKATILSQDEASQPLIEIEHGHNMSILDKLADGSVSKATKALSALEPRWRSDAEALRNALQRQEQINNAADLKLSVPFSLKLDGDNQSMVLVKSTSASGKSTLIRGVRMLLDVGLSCGWVPASSATLVAGMTSASVLPSNDNPHANISLGAAQALTHSYMLGTANQKKWLFLGLDELFSGLPIEGRSATIGQFLSAYVAAGILGVAVTHESVDDVIETTNPETRHHIAIGHLDLGQLLPGQTNRNRVIDGVEKILRQAGVIPNLVDKIANHAKHR